MHYKQKNNLKLFSLALFALFSAFFLSSCEEDVKAPVEITDADAVTEARAIYSSRHVTFSRPNGTYTSSQAASDFGNIGGWDNSAYISSENLRITLAANVIGTAGGMESRIDISDGTQYWVQYKIRFHSAFDWSKGGKAGFGLQVGNGVTGCRADDARAGLGGSFRTMWYNTGSRVFLQPYIYHAGMTGRCGDTFGASYPSSGSISRGTWYTIGYYFKANTGTSYNGTAELKVNGQVVLRRDNIRWSNSDSQRLVKGLYFSVFRGGSTSDWGSGSVGYIYFDDLEWVKM
ncbi:MAG TPA: hypothetical protein VD908_15245 [Cytophagales bacterium]|nr:hypothetical protein [Cytophagales bacterium]